MPEPKNRLLRAVVPIAVIVAGIGVGVAVLVNSSRRNSGAIAPATGAGTSSPQPVVPKPGGSPTGPAAPAQAPASPQPAPQVVAPPATGGPTSPPTQGTGTPAPLGTLHAKVFAEDATAVAYSPLGDLAPKGAFVAQLEFSSIGAGLRSLDLARYLDSIQKNAPNTRVQEEHVLRFTSTFKDAQGNLVPDIYEPTMTPLGALKIEINPSLDDLVGKNSATSAVDLTGLVKEPGLPPARRQLWRETGPGAFEALILNEHDEPVARVERRYEIAPGSYDIRVHQSVQNLTTSPLAVRFWQFGPADLPQDASGYGGDKRRLRFGYFLSPALQGTDPTVSATDFLWSRTSATVLGTRGPQGYTPVDLAVWPNDRSQGKQYRLVWTGMTNRYFGVALHPLLDPQAPNPDKTFARVEAITRVIPPSDSPDPVLALKLRSAPAQIAPGATLDLSMGVYAGPLSRPEIDADPLASASGLSGLVVYNFGGPCGFCTFTFLTSFMLGLLHLLHDYIVHDWALGIICLVVCVRTILHPVTKWSQIRMARFGKQVQGLAPKQKQVQERFKDDPKRQREEMAKVWREEGISPLGALGCLPMFLQTPVWIALYATLYFAVELRHAPAFFGVFQGLSAGRWTFLGDLAEPDRFIYFGRTVVTLPILGMINAINLLPLILGVVFFMQQKYLQPPTAATLTPEQEQQQKMMKVITVVMFPLLMYNAPSGLAVYFIANSTLGILESRYIRAHIKANDLLAGSKEKGRKKGFMQYLQDVAEERRKSQERLKRKNP